MAIPAFGFFDHGPTYIGVLQFINCRAYFPESSDLWIALQVSVRQARPTTQVDVRESREIHPVSSLLLTLV